MDRRHNIFELISCLRSEPWLTQKELCRRIGVHQRQVWAWLGQIEVDVRPGIDRENGRRNVKTYAIRLPKKKLGAV